MEPVGEQIAPEIVQAIIARATARGLSVNGYLRQVLGLKNGEADESAPGNETVAPRNEAMLAVILETEEPLKDMPVVRGSTEETLNMIRRARGGFTVGVRMRYLGAYQPS